MKVVGKRKEPEIVFHASSIKLKEGAIFNDETQKILGKKIGFFKKGVYHYKTHEQANKHWEESIIQGVIKRLNEK